ncbi:hypothetical protein FJR09_01265 [Dolichospermum sp. UHCC 0406]|nr:hypothetical protein [Dolichospermum sp. UHCC 0299]MTJ37517.1 hypothetical protein [Dolichospermum sp. UHCC 0406]
MPVEAKVYRVLIASPRDVEKEEKIIREQSYKWNAANTTGMKIILIVIGANDVFDTELGEIIKSSSVQGQFLKQIYKGKQDELDVDIETALQEYIGNRNLDPDKKRGKAWRYPIGTTITLGSYEKRYFLTAYG